MIEAVALLAHEVEFKSKTILYPPEVHEVSATRLLPTLASVQNPFDDLVVVALPQVVGFLHLEVLRDWSQYVRRNRQVQRRF